MKTPALIALIMVLGLSGCASPGTSDSLKQDWVAYWKSVKGDWDSTKEDWTTYWKDPGGITWELMKGDWAAFWKNVRDDWGSAKEDWTAFWKNQEEKPGEK
jgi:uncharacterized protein YceK